MNNINVVRAGSYMDYASMIENDKDTAQSLTNSCFWLANCTTSCHFYLVYVVFQKQN